MGSRGSSQRPTVITRRAPLDRTSASSVEPQIAGPAQASQTANANLGSPSEQRIEGLGSMARTVGRLEFDELRRVAAGKMDQRPYPFELEV
jgi:hypothetical protein